MSAPTGLDALHASALVRRCAQADLQSAEANATPGPGSGPVSGPPGRAEPGVIQAHPIPAPLGGSDDTLPPFGQSRAMAALQTALAVPGPGYNVFVLAEPGLEPLPPLHHLLRQHAAQRPAPPDRPARGW